MRWYYAGAPVAPGIYLAPRQLELRRVTGAGGTLEGGGAARYLRLPPSTLPLVLVAGAVAGLVYVLLFPIYGLALLVKIVALVFAEGARAAARRLGAGRHRPGH
jgi:hypothetical protein